VQDVLSKLATDAGLLVAAEGHLWVQLIVTVDLRKRTAKVVSERSGGMRLARSTHPDGSSLESVGSLECAADITVDMNGEGQ
jgi:hypothetical protein